jgi:hypothetical protein
MSKGPAHPSPAGPSGRESGGHPSPREVGEMLGLVRQVLADGVVTEEEARALSAFVRARPDVASRWPGDVLTLRLERIFEDRRVDPEEREELARMLAQIVEAEGEQDAAEGPPLPLDDPPPVVRFLDRTFVFAGPLALGSLGSCHRILVKMGGTYATTVGEDTDYLVVGAFQGADWRRSAAAAEIRRALELKAEGVPLAIVSEEEFTRALPGGPREGPRRRF